ncbi:MAG: precorrin-2 C(20)-methyltransferase [Rhodospirillaceae bacterium]|jgi:precorrin-2/cobalt-factor-2 C20-methyltransferase|nr:precorrin-2 C(20)-methyltransferase [Rhodospirillaceae bacterium]MDP6645606.1 precorrin-2 C(20)-methyltransferase [Rhodospirillales bacterium]|tara:strand:- start:315 stop:1028 length:714 start_codon:yes stop_codon:yes gene_type:complete
MTADAEEIRIWGLGVGPGDPELITLKAQRILRSADVVAYPAPADGDSLVRAIAAPHIPDGAEELVISTPMLAERYPAQDVYDRAAQEIEKRVEAGKTVAILCEGDPFFYGSFMYLYGRLSERLRVGVVPGVSSLSAGAAELGLPLAERNDVVAVIPATLDESALSERLAVADAAVIIKVGRHLDKVRRVLDDQGLLGGAKYIERATMEAQRMCDLADMSDQTAPYFSLIIVRKSVDI